MRFLALTVAFVLAACAGKDVEVRVCNLTGYPVTDLDASEFTDLDLADGECTEYIEPAYNAYGYTHASFDVGADHFEATPIDYLGDGFEQGRWSYQLKILDYALRRVSTFAVEDER